MTLFHITTHSELNRAQSLGYYRPKGFAAEGFIHCSYQYQVVATANRIFRGQMGLVLLVIDPTVLDCDVIDENLAGGAEPFPHIYGQLPLHAVQHVYDFPCDRTGEFQLPMPLR